MLISSHLSRPKPLTIHQTCRSDPSATSDSLTMTMAFGRHYSTRSACCLPCSSLLVTTDVCGVPDRIISATSGTDCVMSLSRWERERLERPADLVCVTLNIFNPATERGHAHTCLLRAFSTIKLVPGSYRSIQHMLATLSSLAPPSQTLVNRH